jgi:hypothetical protein
MPIKDKRESRSYPFDCPGSVAGAFRLDASQPTVIRVTVIRKDLGKKRKVGEIEFRGIMVASADGPAHIPVDGESNQVHSYQCNPPGLVSDESAQRIAGDLSRGFDMGKIGEDEWRAD